MNLAPETLESLVSTVEAANLAGVTATTIRSWAKRGHLVPTCRENGRPLYRWIDVARAERKTRDAVHARRNFSVAA